MLGPAHRARRPRAGPTAHPPQPACCGSGRTCGISWIGSCITDCDRCTNVFRTFRESGYATLSHPRSVPPPRPFAAICAANKTPGVVWDNADLSRARRRETPEPCPPAGCTIVWCGSSRRPTFHRPQIVARQDQRSPFPGCPNDRSAGAPRQAGCGDRTTGRLPRERPASLQSASAL